MNQKLHILFLCGWYPSRVAPTNGDFIQRHAKAISSKHKVSVLHIISDKNSIKNIEIDFQEINGIATYIAYVKISKNPITKLIRFYNAYKQILRKIEPINNVHLNTLFPFGIFALHLKWFKKIPFIISEHWSGYNKPHSKNISFLKKMISKIITKNAAFVCPVSNSLKESMLNFGLKGNYKAIPNVVNTKLFHPTNKKEKQFTVLHVSGMDDEPKNISGMLNTAKKLEKIIGSFTWKFIGGSSNKFKPLIKKLNFKQATIKFEEHISHQKLVTHMQSAHLFVMFSNYENLPCVILESISCGTPIISTNVGGIYEYFQNDFGYLIEKQNETQLLEKIHYIYKNSEVNSQKMHLYAIKHFSEETVSNEFSKLYCKSHINRRN